MKTNDLEARLDALENRQAIDALIAGYAQAFDNQDETLLSSLWYEDSRLLLGDYGTASGGRNRDHGAHLVQLRPSTNSRQAGWVARFNRPSGLRPFWNPNQ